MPTASQVDAGSNAPGAECCDGPSCPVPTLRWLHRCYEALVMDGPRPPTRNPVPGMATGLLHWSIENDLGAAMLEYALRASDVRTLRRALGHLRRARLIAPRTAYPQAVVLTNLGLALCAGFHHTGHDTELDDAIALLRTALTSALEFSGTADNAGVAGSAPRAGQELAVTSMRLLASALHRRFEIAGQQADLYEAGAMLSRVVQQGDDPDPVADGRRPDESDKWQPVLVRDDHAGL